MFEYLSNKILILNFIEETDIKLFFKIFQYVLFVTLIILISCSDEPVGPEYPSYGWSTSTPEAQGMNSHLIQQAFQQGENRGFVDCILIIRNGYLVAEKYYNGFGKDIPHNVMSVSKSFLSAMTGIALRDGHLDNLNEKALDHFPEYIYPNIDPRKYDITIRNLLMMRMGIDHDQNVYNQVHNSSNWIKTTIDLPLIYDPGTRFCYNTFQTHLLSAIITKASGMSTMDFAKKYLLEEMNIDCTEWWQDPQGYYFGGNSMHFTPRNMARFGYLYMNKGKLDGKQIVPAEWVEESLTNYTNFSNSTWGDLDNVNYGYLWWLGEIKNNKVFLAIGHGGQFVINFLDLNLIVVTTADWQLGWDIADQHERSILSIVADYIVPAVIP
jgi:CubicO group peptidase (beta-lactamase class C family)